MLTVERNTALQCHCAQSNCIDGDQLSMEMDEKVYSRRKYNHWDMYLKRWVFVPSADKQNMILIFRFRGCKFVNKGKLGYSIVRFSAFWKAKVLEGLKLIVFIEYELNATVISTFREISAIEDVINVGIALSIRDVNSASGMLTYEI
ncbi:hypothetical protein GJ496_008494 [Pomphorhynchus laevis]|nr:hypothetical protein GJ496_008494 [Pomphorhynchus laevis]